jgi:hypothetical protein
MADTFDPEVEIARLEAARATIRRLREDLRKLKEKDERASREPIHGRSVPVDDAAAAASRRD